MKNSIQINSINNQTQESNSGIFNNILSFVKKEVNIIESKEDLQEVLDYNNLKLYLGNMFGKINLSHEYIKIVYDLLNKNIIDNNVFKDLYIKTFIEDYVTFCGIENNLYILELGVKTGIIDIKDTFRISKRLNCKVNFEDINFFKYLETNYIDIDDDEFSYDDFKYIPRLIKLGLLKIDDIKGKLTIKLDLVFEDLDNAIEKRYYPTSNIYNNLKDILLLGFEFDLLKNKENIKNNLIKIITYNINNPSQRYTDNTSLISLIEILLKNNLLSSKERKKILKRIKIGFETKVNLQTMSGLREFQNLIAIGKINKEDFKDKVIKKLDYAFERIEGNLQLASLEDRYLDEANILILLIKISMENGYLTKEEILKQYKEKINFLITNFSDDRKISIFHGEFTDLGLVDFNDYSGVKLEKKYKQNLGIYNDILKLVNSDFELTKYLDTIFLDKKELQKVGYFIKMNIGQYFRVDIKKAIKNPKGFYFGFFMDCVEKQNTIITSSDELDNMSEKIKLKIQDLLMGIDKNDFVGYNNFTDYMFDEPLFSYIVVDDIDKDKVIPFTKKWFLEKPERKNLLKPGNMKILQDYGLLGDYGPVSIQKFTSFNILFFEKLYNFVKSKLLKSEHDSKIFENSKLSQGKHFNKIFSYFLEYRQKSLIDMISRLNNIEDLELNIDIRKFKIIDDFINEDGNIDYGSLKINYEKLLKLNGEKKVNRKLNRFDNFVKSKDNKNLDKYLMENIVLYFNTLYERKLNIKIVADIKKLLGYKAKELKFNEINPEKYTNELFTEAYKIMKYTIKNRTQISTLLIRYLNGEFDEQSEVNQYNTRNNKIWLENNLTKEQQKIWLSSNKKIIKLGDDFDNSEIISKNNDERIQHHFLLAIDKIKVINGFGKFDFNIDYENIGELIKEFNLKIKKKEKEIKKIVKYDNVFEDLQLQIYSIKELQKGGINRSKKENEVIIEKELDPLKCLMMGNWVDGSCLSYYNSVGNYYSSISNTIDVNKGVFYIRNQNGNLLGRCLVTIGDTGEIARYSMYYAGRVDSPIDELFDEYMIKLSEKLGMKLNGSDSYRVENIESEYWYNDGVKNVVF